MQPRPSIPLDPHADPFKPPAIPTLCHCLHCGREYESYLIQWEEYRAADGKPTGYWACAHDDCDGRGFGFDIFPVDPDYIGEDGERLWSRDEASDETGEGDDESADGPVCAWDEDDDEDFDDDGADWLPPNAESSGETWADDHNDDDLPW